MSFVSSNGRLVFVYGTLRSGEQRDINRLQPKPELLGTARLAGRLYDLGSYPGLRLDRQAESGEPASAEVVGEVYAIDAALERVLDEIEEVWPKPNGEYTKREVIVRLDTNPDTHGSALGVECRCLVYEATPGAVAGRPAITGGDWVAHRLRID